MTNDEHNGSLTDSLPRSILQEGGSGLVGFEASKRMAAVSHSRQIWAHAGVLLVILVLLIPFVGGSTITIPDEAVYSAQARNIRNGTWSSPRTMPELDPTGIMDPLIPTDISSDRIIPYSRHITYPILLSPLYAVGGRFAMLLLSVVGLWGAAVTAAFIARSASEVTAIWVLWSVGIGSPLFFYGFTVTAHSLAAAMAGLALLGFIRFNSEHRSIHLLYGLPAVPLLVLLRSEGSIVAVSMGAAFVLTSFRMPFPRNIDIRRTLTGCVVVILAGATYLLDSRWARAITGKSSRLADPGKLILGEDSGPWGVIWHSILRPFDGDGLNATVTVVLAVVALLLAPLAFRLVPKKPLLGVALVALAGLSASAAAIGSIIAPIGFITGFVAGYPAVVAGLLLLSLKQLEDADRGALLICSLLSVGLLVMTVYEIGGATEWGGRFFQVLIPILVPLGLYAWTSTATSMSVNNRRIIAASLIVASVSLTAISITTARTYRSDYSTWVSKTIEFATKHGGDEQRPLVLVTDPASSGWTRYFWDSEQKVRVLNASPPDFVRALSEASGDGFDQVTATTTINPDNFEFIFGSMISEDGWTVTHKRKAIGSIWLYQLAHRETKS